MLLLCHPKYIQHMDSLSDLLCLVYPLVYIHLLMTPTPTVRRESIPDPP